MINNIASLKRCLKYEKKLYNIDGFVGLCRSFVGYETSILWKFQKRLRYTEYCLNTHKQLLYYINLKWLNHYRNTYGLHIGLNVFDEGLKIMHLGPILTNQDARVGKNCSIHINTAIVSHGLNKGVPCIGNNCVIGVGAVVLGSVIIADGIAIGAGSVVNKSFIEKNIAIAGIPARKISNNGKNKWGITNIDINR